MCVCESDVRDRLDCVCWCEGEHYIYVWGEEFGCMCLWVSEGAWLGEWLELRPYDCEVVS